MTYPIEVRTAGHPGDRRNGFLILTLCFVFVTSLGAQVPAETSNPRLVTLSEIQVGGPLPTMGHNNCISVWTNGRFHLELRLQQSAGTPANLLVYDSTLPSAQLRELKEILENITMKRLSAPVSPPPSAAKIWLRGTRAWITRDSAIQEIGYFEWGTYETAHNSDPNRVIVNSPQPDAAKALRPLEDWLHQVQSEHLSPGNSEPTACDVSPNI